MEAVRSPCVTKWLVAAGGSGWTTSAGASGEGDARCRALRVLSVRASSGRSSTKHGGFFPILLGHRATTVVSALPRRKSPSSVFPSAEKPDQKPDAETAIPKVQTERASGLSKAAEEIEDEQVQDQTQSEPLLMEETETENAEVVLPQTATESLEAAAEVEATPVEAHTSTESLQASAETETIQVETQIPTDDSSAEPETVQGVTQTPVHVRFMLHKSCAFGEQFLLVGENPTLGSWDPAKAIPLAWSKGDVWTAEVELPAEEEIEFKFILRPLSGKIKWQPGPNRVLKTWETPNTIVVAPEWESVADQEEINEKGLLVTPEEGTIPEDSTGTTGTDGEAVTVQNITDENQEHMVEAGEEKPLAQEGDPVLIPGLASSPLPVSSTEGEVVSSSEIIKGVEDVASSASGESGKSTEEVKTWW